MLVSRKPARNSGMASMSLKNFTDCCGWRGEVGVHLGKEFCDLGVEVAGGVEDEALEDEADGVERRGDDEDEETGKQAEARAKAGGDAGLTEAGAIDTEHDDGGGDEPEEREQRNGSKREGEQGKGCGEGCCEAGALDGAAARRWRGWELRGAGPHRREDLQRLLGRDLLIDLIAQFFGELDLGCSAVPAIDEGAFIFAMKKRVATGTDAGAHYFQG